MVSFNYSNWRILRGADYRWEWLTPDVRLSTTPSVTFSMMKSLGFNLARIPVDWKYLDTNSSTPSVWASVAANADANGVYCIWLFGGGDPTVMPRSITSQYSSAASFYSAWWSNGIIPGGKYAGTSLWDAEFQGLWKPLLQVVGSHPSTVGLGLWNEPSGLPNSGVFGDSLHTLHAYYEYETQRIRTISNIAVGFQVTSNGGGDSTTIPIVAPSPDLKPYYFEGHVYSYSSSTLSDWALGVSNVGALGYVGETQVLTLAFYQQLKSQGWSVSWFSWTCNGGTELLDTNCRPDSNAIQLSQEYSQVWG